MIPEKFNTPPVDLVCFSNKTEAQDRSTPFDSIPPSYTLLQMVRAGPLFIYWKPFSWCTIIIRTAFNPLPGLTQSASVITVITMKCIFNTLRHMALGIETLNGMPTRELNRNCIKSLVAECFCHTTELEMNIFI